MERRDFFKFGLVGVGALVLADDSWALKYYPMASDKKWAVLYGTWCGSSRDAAVWISEGMGGVADVFDVREDPDLRGFDHIVIGGAIRNGVTRQELQDYITGNKVWLEAKVRGLFAICGNGERPVGPRQTAMFIDDHLAKLCDVHNIPSRVFNGRITKSLMEPDIAKMMENRYPQLAGKPMADYDLLKRADCMASGKEVLVSIK
jgi:menaquinone-dependent protoporphyrinogen IX oxidase